METYHPEEADSGLFVMLIRIIDRARFQTERTFFFTPEQDQTGGKSQAGGIEDETCPGSYQSCRYSRR